MTNLNLKANTPEENTVLTHLIPMVSDELADKINNGVRIQKNGKTVINKKDLTSFMSFAMEQAKKQIAESQRKGAQAVCVHGDDIMSWAIHYFEEDSIEGKLYNEDGTEYKPPKPQPKTTPTTAKPYTPPKPAPKPQISMFELLNAEPEQKAEPLKVESQTQPEPVEVKPEPDKPKGSAMWQHYLSVKEKYKDCIVFYRLGDFYEMFGEDAKIASDILNLTLTGRDCGLAERVPMTGVPFHAVDNYISKLVSKDYKVAVCEQLDGGIDVDRVIVKESKGNRIVDVKSGEYLSEKIEDLSVEEMQQFDGDMDEPDDLITVTKLIGETPDDEQSDDDMITEDEIKAYFDKDVLLDLLDVLGDKVDLI